jgi:recombination protein RecT
MTTATASTPLADTPTSQALAKMDGTPRAFVEQHRDRFAEVLPSHISRPEVWIRVAQSALKKGKRLPNGQFELERAAANNPAAFMAALLEAARLGLDPGTDEFYLTCRPIKGRDEILGIVGYQGYIELMYRAGAVDSVVVEVVRMNDRFRYFPGRDEIPDHEVDWDQDRGGLRLAYGFCRMNGGAVSKVIVLSRTDIDAIKAKSPTAGSEYSAWNTNPESMWLKSVARRLRKWVPTSAEFRSEMARTQAAANDQRDALADDLGGELPRNPTDDYDPDEVIDAELVDDQPGSFS